MSKARWLVARALSVLLAFDRCALAIDLSGRELAKAKPGAVVDVPSGTFNGSFTIPPGVTLRGTGYRQTTIDARGSAVGVVLKGKGARLENLSILNSGTGVELSASEGAEVSRVMILGGTIGIRGGDLAKATIENTVVARALIGISLNKASDCTVANCTITTANACGISVSAATNTAVMNNLVVDAGTGIVVGGREQQACDRLQRLHCPLDRQTRRTTATADAAHVARRRRCGFDAHSVQLGVAFANPSQNDFHPVSTLSWNPARNVTAGWGTAALTGHQAPATDIDGQPRRAPFGLGSL